MKNIAIDGPAGAGKSTIARLVAQRLGYIYVDTGAMYRAEALACVRAGVSPDDEESVCRVCGRSRVSLSYENGEQAVILDGENVNALIRDENVSLATSKIAAYARVREMLLALQREIASENNVIMDGRDIGTSVLPGADLKIYLTASVETRAKRRYTEYVKKGIGCDISEIKKDIAARDERDINREISPLKMADDAVLIDSSEMTIEEVCDAIISLEEQL